VGARAYDLCACGDADADAGDTVQVDVEEKVEGGRGARGVMLPLPVEEEGEEVLR
jgi:hypothetical protein